MQQLSPTAKVILGFLRLGARTGYEIKSGVEVSTRFFWGASFGQIYPELRRLEGAGLVTSRDESHGARHRRGYELTEAGERALQEWLTSSAARQFDYRDEGLLKLFFGDLLEPDQLLESMRMTQAQFESALAFFRTELEPKARAGEDAGERFPSLALEFGTALLEFIVDWWAAAEDRLSRQQRPTARGGHDSRRSPRVETGMRRP